MTSRTAMATIGVVFAITGQQARAETTTDQRCASGADVRLIEIRFAEDGGLPCKVIYRPEADSDTLGIVSWQNLQSVEACEAQASEVIERLTLEGWTCVPDGEPIGARAANVTETLTTESEASGVDDVVDRPATFVANPDLQPPSDGLRAVVEDDLARLDVTLDGALEATVAAYGDLNADDVDDALVFYTYASPQPAYRQFLAAYLFDGEDYRLTATRPISGNVSATMDARIDAVDRGVVHVALKAYEPGDAACCPSGTRNLALALRDLELVEIDAEAPTR